MKDYGPGNNKNYRYVLVIIDNFRKIGWMVPLKKNAQTIRDCFEKIIVGSKRKPNLIKSDRRKEFYNSVSQNFLKNNNNKHLPRSISFGAVFAKRFNRTFTDLLKGPVFERGDASWIDLLLTITKQCNNGIHSPTKLTPL